MPIRNSSLSKLAKISTTLIIFTAIFAISYAQSPLFTSNQNQYFLHGFAQAGVGNLNQDWLANTLDPTPVFSLLVEITQRYIGIQQIYYLYYAVLMGVYLFSLLGISNTIFKIFKSKSKTLVMVALLIAIHSAAMRFVLSRTLGINWTYLLEDGVADQRILGPVFQPSTFGVLLLLSIYLFLRRKPYLAILSAILAATVHPTYLLSAGVLTFTYMLIIYLEEKNLVRSILIGLFALLVVGPILYYVYTSFGGTSPVESAQAREILVNFRIPHHAIVSNWFDATAVIKICIVFLAIFLARKTRLFLILLLPTLTAISFTVIQVVAEFDWLALLFPWRLSIFIIPLSITTILATLVIKILDTRSLSSTNAHQVINIISTIFIFLAVLIGGIRFKLDLDRKAAQPERSVQAYVNNNKSPGETYLIPVKMQDFRLFTSAPAFIEFKSIPYKDIDVIEWYRRERLADRFYKTGDCNILEELSASGFITHAVLVVNETEVHCHFLEELYKDEFYRLIQINSTNSNPY
ncbi:MAG: hypothetical protein KAI94_06330 [Anaerolineales bacterium]|nr:hypothetical protein [Anaerolineales bacterium]